MTPLSPGSWNPQVEVPFGGGHPDDDAVAGDEPEAIDVVPVAGRIQMSRRHARHGQRHGIGRHVVQALDIEQPP